MPVYNKAKFEDLFNQLRKPDQWESSWAEAREILKTDPEDIVAPLCDLIDEFIEKDIDTPLKASIILSLEDCTKKQPGLVPVDLLRRVLAEDNKADYLSILCTASMLVRIDPQFIITKGFQQILHSTELAHLKHDDPAWHVVDQKAKSMAHYIWTRVADGDPESLIPLLEHFAGVYGWQKHTTQLLADKILEAAPRHFNIIYDSIEFFKGIGEQNNIPEGQWKSPVEYIQALMDIQVKLQRKNVAELIANEISLDKFVPVSAPVDKVSFRPDPSVDKLMEDLLSPDPEVEYLAREILMHKLSNPSYALVKGVCEVAHEMFQSDIHDERCDSFLASLYFILGDDPKLTPVEDLKAWSSDSRLPGDTLILIYAILAQACPAWVVEYCFAGSVGIAVERGDIFSSCFLSKLGNAYPELIIEFATKWFDRMGYTPGSDDLIADALEEIAIKHPDHLNVIIDLLIKFEEEEILRDESDENDGMVWIDLNFHSIARRIEKLKKLKENNHGG